MRRHAERVDIVLLAELLKLKRVVALMAIKDKQPARPNYLAICMLDKVLQPLNSYLVSSPAVVNYSNAPLGLQIRALSCVVVLCFEDKVGRNCPAYRVDRSDQSHPLTISLLDSNRLSTSL